ncbi:glycerophosphoryl diester phosphodiesterase [Anseongella ginsenosidimutans]|uniref:Glycerophosphoryl diester phosphodiesterase n=1 Tax=Anseongella ginsenosidimutans TaxID=496056 RepID=A0A4R3KTD5_9SPHI|nr:phosphatidylinositol-specific phospholipase C/glycerophosphodiester phosphodiesterase family protein [Anseongella ginsenosidimutans]QEC53381.1 alkaline phosphatase [Anseongella ginsenosidimutans]TCS88267.1 glycerophosphoryl diester phosphodiesterase [Anseongella ginsenosidimutans]
MIRATLYAGLPAFLFLAACGTQNDYTAANAHSHNDYEQDMPFEQAFHAGFGSVEADVFLRKGELFVAHDAADIRQDRTLNALYLKPIASSGNGRKLQLLIDLKTGADSTLPILEKQLAQYPGITAGSEAGKEAEVKVVISGSRPDPEKWAESPAFIYFDGRPGEEYSAAALEKTGLISDSFRNYTDWDGKQPMDGQVKEQLRKVVQNAHELGKPFRFWAVPDTPLAWELMTELGVDYINTDKIAALADWLKKPR